MASSVRDRDWDRNRNTHSLVLFWWQVQRLEQWTPQSSSWEQILFWHFSPFQPSVQIHSPVRKSHSPPFWATVQLKVNRSFCRIEEVLYPPQSDCRSGRGLLIIVFVPKLTEPFPGSHRSDDSPPRSIPPDTPPHTAMTMRSVWLIVNGARMQKKNSSWCWWIQRNYLPEVMSVVANINNLNKQEGGRGREGGETEWNGCNKCEDR